MPYSYGHLGSRDCTLRPRPAGRPLRAATGLRVGPESRFSKACRSAVIMIWPAPLNAEQWIRRYNLVARRNSMGRFGKPFAAALATALLCSASYAGPVGERHLQTGNPTASLRDSQHRNIVRITVWYPAGFGAKDKSLDIGEPGKPLFRVGKAAPDAPFADSKLRPVVLFSHGFGGSARMMAWFTTALAEAGYVV